MSDRVASGCVDAGRMLGLLEGTLPESEQARLEAHLEGCAACRGAFDSMAAEGRFWDDIPRFAATDRRTARPADDADEEDEEPLNFLEPATSPGRIGRFGRYEVLEVLGRGGMGIVLKAFDPGLHRVVAIKVLSPRLATSASARRRFEREARAAASVVHEHVVTIHAVEEARGLPYLVMQYVAGRSLQQRIDRDGPLDLESILRIGMQTAAGLAAAHAQGLVHRDVKPANILLENGIERVKITDFGLARAVDDASLTQSGVVAGTPQYMAPEQARAETVDHRADLFSLGSVLYAMCTGRSPFRAETTVGVIRRVCDDTPRPIREVNPAVPDWLAGIVAVLHAKDPARRYQSAGEVAGLLAGHLAQLRQPTTAVFPTAAVPVAPPPPDRDLEFDTIPAAKEPSRRGPGCWILLGMLIAILGLFLAAVVLYFAMGHEEKPATVVESPRPFLPVPGTALPVRGSSAPTGRMPTIDPIRAFTAHTGVVKSLAISSDGRFALSGSGYPSGDMTARLWDLEAGREVHRLAGSLGQVLGVALSPDGRRALTCGEYPTVRLWDVEDGREIRRFPGHAGGVNAVAFSPDGRRAVTAGIDDAVIHLRDLDTGDVICQFLGHTSKVFAVAYSPDGHYILSGGMDRTVRLWDAETGREVRKLPGPSHSVEAVAFSPDGRLAIAGGLDRIVWVWDVETGREHRRMVGHEGIIAGLAFTPDGRRALSVSPPEGRLGDATMRLWDIDAGREIARVEGPGGSGFWSIALLPDGRRALTGGSDGAIRMWSLPYVGPSSVAAAPGPEVIPGDIQVVLRQSHWAEAVALPADGRFAISANEDHSLRLWDPRDGREIRKLDGHEDEVSDVAISDDGRIAVSGSLDRTIRVWDVESGRSVPLRGHERQVRAVTISRDGRFALSAGDEDEARYWDLAAGKGLRRLQGHTKRITSVAISPDGRLGLSGSLDGTARLWDLATGGCPLVVGPLATGPGVSAVAILPDGHRIVIGWQDGTREIHDIEGQAPFHRLAGHRAFIRDLQASRDGRLILSAGGGALRLWDPGTDLEVCRLEGIGGGIVCGTILPDSREILFGCYDATIRLWRLPDSPGGSKPF